MLGLSAIKQFLFASNFKLVILLLRGARRDSVLDFYPRRLRTSLGCFCSQIISSSFEFRL